jgi:nucleoside-diphosphate-sugar epimerase
MIKKPKILICGGAGYIGGYVTDLLSEKGYDVTVYDTLIYETRYLKKVPFIFGDIRDKKTLRTLINKFDVVIWLAALVGDPACAIQPSISNEINFKSVQWLAKNYKGRIIFTSTCSVYGINNDLIDESAIPNPLSVYAQTKLEAEKAIIKNSKNYLIFRLGTLFGLGDNHSRIRLDLVVNVLTKKAILGEPIVIASKEQWRPLLHVKDVAEAIAFGIENNVKGLYNLSYKNFRISDISKEIFKLTPSSKIKYMDLPEEDMRNYRVISDKFKNLGWKPKYTIKDGILEISRVIQSKRIKEPNHNIYSNAATLITTINELKK